MKRTSRGQLQNVAHQDAEVTCVVAIPAKNEEDRISRCLHALADQKGVDIGRLGVLVLVNGSTDATAAVAEGLRTSLPYKLRILDLHLPPSMGNAGAARRCAMNIGWRWLAQMPAGGLLLTTDADSCVSTDWVWQNIKAIEGGADAVAGRVIYSLDNESLAVQRYKQLEHIYEGLAARIEAYIDPILHDPWPSHRTESGASLAIRASAYHRIGGIPRVEVGEDRALCAAVTAHGLKLRHAPDVLVQTSARLAGRAAGGAADCLFDRTRNFRAACDPQFANAFLTAKRARYRRLLRQAHEHGRLNSRALYSLLKMPEGMAEQLAGQASFQTIWEEILRRSPRLGSPPLLLHRLPFEIAQARLLVHLLRFTSNLKIYTRVDRAGSLLFGFAESLSQIGVSLE